MIRRLLITPLLALLAGAAGTPTAHASPRSTPCGGTDPTEVGRSCWIGDAGSASDLYSWLC